MVARIVSIAALVGLIASIGFAVSGHFGPAGFSACLVFMVTLLINTARIWTFSDGEIIRRPRDQASTDGEGADAGAVVAIMLVIITMMALDWPLNFDQPLVLSAGFRHTALIILLATMFSVDYAWRVWRKQPINP